MQPQTFQVFYLSAGIWVSIKVIVLVVSSEPRDWFWLRYDKNNLLQNQTDLLLILPCQRHLNDTCLRPFFYHWQCTINSTNLVDCKDCLVILIGYWMLGKSFTVIWIVPSTPLNLYGLFNNPLKLSLPLLSKKPFFSPNQSKWTV